jgi:hypothetical protein
VSEIVTRFGVPRGWPAGLALQYLTIYLKFDIAEPHLRAIRRFHDLAAKHGLLPGATRELEIYEKI